MSHFAVAVISRTPEEVDYLLAPYQENNMGDCPSEYLEFVDTEENGRYAYENGYAEKLQAPDGQLFDKYDPQFKDTNSDDFNPVYLIPDGYKEILVAYKDLYPTFDDYMEKYREVERDPETGRYGYWTNPNAKWDYWRIGGRFRGLLRASKGTLGELSWEYTMDKENQYHEAAGQYDQAQIKDIDFSLDQKLYNKAVRFWEVYVEKAPLKPEENPEAFDSFYTPEHYKQLYESKESYAKEQASFSTWALVTPEGEWYQKGDMGWWATHNGTAESFRNFSEAFERILSECDPEWYITVVDCHI